jgi:uncharacterized protein (TIGR03083 family)
MFDAELAAFSALTRGLTSEQWEAPSLCAAWTVREVVLHIAYHTHRAGLRQNLGNADKWTARLAERAHADTTDGLVAWLGSQAPDSARKSRINICELVIHQQDVRRPLGIMREFPESTMRTCLELCTSVTGNLLVIGERRRRGRGLQLVATDLAWSTGEGPQVTGTGAALLMAVAGRPAALTDVTGPGVSLLAERMEAAMPWVKPGS